MDHQISRFDNQFSANVTVMVRAARAASRGLLRDFGEIEKLQVSQKSLGDFVSTADLNAEKIIIEELQKARSDYTILSEEAGEIKGDNENFRFIVDPLDGTFNFLRGIPHWAISIALEEKTIKGPEVIAGVIYDPVKDELFWAEKNTGAFFSKHRMRVSGVTKMPESVIAIESKSDKNKQEKLAQLAVRTRLFGSAALDLCYVAAGRVDGYFDKGTKIWDVAAGQLMVKEAGGIVTDISGRGDYQDFTSKEEILAGNRNIHKLLTSMK